MNKESLPLIFALIVPVIFVLMIILYIYGYDITYYLKLVPTIYYVAILPILLGFTVAIIKYVRPD